MGAHLRIGCVTQGRSCTPYARKAGRSVVPWKIILYFDGISPRDPLAKGKDYRGMDAVYWSFAEFDEHLQNKDLWFTLSTARVAK
eukprot:6434404-Pyramimonas_sp.AAC.1